MACWESILHEEVKRVRTENTPLTTKKANTEVDRMLTGSWSCVWFFVPLFPIKLILHPTKKLQ